MTWLGWLVLVVAAGLVAAAIFAPDRGVFIAVAVLLIVGVGVEMAGWPAVSRGQFGSRRDLDRSQVEQVAREHGMKDL